MSTIFGKDTTKLRFGNGKHGKPYLIGSELKFNISHAELRKANDILKDALGFFAKDRKK